VGPLARAATAAVAALVVAVGATACGERTEPLGNQGQLFPVTVANGERPLVVPGPPRRVAVLDPALADILASLGARSRVAGLPLGADGRVRLGRLRALRPDLILASSDLGDAVLSRAAAATGAPVYLASARSLREVERTITQLGVIMATPVPARRLVRAIERQRQLVATRVAARPRVPVFVDLGFFTTASNQSLIGDLVREARGDNVASDALPGVPFDLGALRASDPAVYVAVSDSGSTLATLRKNPRTRRLTSVRSGRVVTIDAELLRPGPRIGQGLLELARALHPDAFR